MAAFDDALELVKHAEGELPTIRAAYEASLTAKAVSPKLLIEIKNVCENLRSALDFAATGLFEKYGSSKKANPKIHFPYANSSQTRVEFEKSNRVEACIPGLTASRPDIVSALVDMQHYTGVAYAWVPKFMELTNENKHQRLTPQTRIEHKELRISGGGASISVGQGASISIGPGASISVGGAIIRGGQTFDANRPPIVQGGRVDVITWVSFLFSTNNEPVLPLLQNAVDGVRRVVESLAGK